MRSGDTQELPPLVLIRAVLLMGARFSKHPYVLGTAAGTRYCCDQLYTKARALFLADLNFEPLSMIQAGLMMSTSRNMKVCIWLSVVPQVYTGKASMEVTLR